MTDKKLRLAALFVVIVFSVAVSGTLAYFTVSTLSIENDFFPARLSIRVVENFDQDADGNYVKTDVCIKNESVSNASSNAYVRVKLVPSWRYADGSVAGVPTPALPAWTEPEGAEIAPGVTICINNQSAFDHINGYYYYKGLLKSGKETPVLIEKLSVDYSLLTGTVYDGLTFELTVMAEGLNDAPGATENAWGMTFHTEPSPYWSLFTAP